MDYTDGKTQNFKQYIARSLIRRIGHQNAKMLQLEQEIKRLRERLCEKCEDQVDDPYVCDKCGEKTCKSCTNGTFVDRGYKWNWHKIYICVKCFGDRCPTCHGDVDWIYRQWMYVKDNINCAEYTECRCGAVNCYKCVLDQNSCGECDRVLGEN
jgi:hypothetical protein